MLKYWVLVTKNEHGVVSSLFSPDLSEELLDSSEVVAENSFDFRQFIREKLLQHFENKQKIIMPKRLAQLENVYPLTPTQHWESFKFKPNKKYNVCAKGLPITGYILNVVSILTSLFITFMALKIASHKDDGDDDTESTALAICGATFNSLINFSLYVISGASDGLLDTGYLLDNLCRKELRPFSENDQRFLTKQQIYKVISLAFTSGACILTNSLVGGIRQYQEFILLARKYLELNPDLSDDDREYYYKLINSLVIVTNIGATSYCAIAFQGSFARKLIARYMDKISKVIPQERLDAPRVESDRLIVRMGNVRTEIEALQPAPLKREDLSSDPDAGHVLQFRGYQNISSPSYTQISATSTGSIEGKQASIGGKQRKMSIESG